MLPLLVLAAALPLACAIGGPLCDCPIERDLRVGSDRVVDVLEQFYKDLVYVGASTGASMDRNYTGLTQELQSWSGPWISEKVHKFLSWIIYLMCQDRIDFARAGLNTLRSYGYVDDGTEMSYLYYLDAEADRLLGNNADATTWILSAYLERREAPGVTMDELERLDGLIALQKVSQFNQDVDRCHGLRQSPDYKALPMLHLRLGPEMSPLRDIREQASRSLAKAAAGSSAASGDMQRNHPEHDNLRGQSASHASTKAILCEFATKLGLLGVSSRDEAPVDYGSVMEQVRRVNPDFARQLDSKVVSHLDADLRTAREGVREIWATELKRSQYDRVLEQFTRYFTAELHRRRMGDRCNLRDLDDMNDEMIITKSIRRTHRGVSLAKLTELEARVVLLWLKCFHERVKLAYGLDGAEDEQQLAAKRRLVGADRDRVLPDSDIF